MTQRVVKTVQPFEFRSDFQPAPTGADAIIVEDVPEADNDTEERISLTGPELAELLSMARSEGVTEALQMRSEEMREDLSGVTAELTDALGNLVTLAEHIEVSGMAQGACQKTLDLINAATKRIVDGQGDLFSTIEQIGASHEDASEEQV